jgi:hypothetical protein
VIGRHAARSSGCWPSREQELLLRAVLLAGSEALSAWQAWLASNPNLTRLDTSSLRLLPLLCSRLKVMGVSHPQMDLLRGARRHAWYQNRLLEEDLARTLRALHAVGVRTMILKGAALVRTAYSELAARPMGDVDVLVTAGDAERAIGVLRGMNLQPTHPVTARRIPLVHSVGFTAPTGRTVDLHWHLVEEDCRPGSDDEFWERALPADVDGVATLTLDLTDQLYHVCVHGVRWEKEPPLRWVADAVLLARTGAIEWERLATLGERHRLALQLRVALEYLRARFAVAVPPHAIDSLASLPTARWERREYELKTLPYSYLRRLAFHWYNHRRQQKTGGGLRRLATFPVYLLGRWGLDSPLEAPVFLVRELWRRRAAERPPLI